MASIAAERQEILRLITRMRGAVHPGNGRGNNGANSKRLAQHREDLGRIREARQRIESQLLDGDGALHELFRKLEQRVADIEARLGNGASPKPLPEAPKELPASNYALTGEIKEGFLADILQLLSSNEMTGVFTVEDRDSRVLLYYREGEVFHAEGEGTAGESAFFAAMAMDSGHFHFDETDKLPEERTINSQTQFLVLEALRQIDEARAQHGE